MNESTIKPLEDYVLIKIEKEEKKKTDSGIFLPESASEEKSQTGKVIAVGFSGTEIEEGKYLMVKSEDILAVVE